MIEPLYIAMGECLIAQKRFSHSFAVLPSYASLQQLLTLHDVELHLPVHANRYFNACANVKLTAIDAQRNHSEILCEWLEHAQDEHQRWPAMAFGMRVYRCACK
jgi:hypothetical protein